MHIWLITVNYGDPAPTASLLESLQACQKNTLTIKMGIADNASQSTNYNKLNKLKTDSDIEIELFPFSINQFYWPAANQVINKMLAINGSYPDWVMVCNNDITFQDSNFFKKLEKIDLREYPILGPEIIGENTRLPLNPFMVEPMSAIKRLYWKLFYTSFTFSRLLLISKKIRDRLFYYNNQSKTHGPLPVYAVHGAAILFSKHFFDKGGWLDDNFSLYGEELTVAEIAKQVGCPVTFNPELKLIHQEHTSTQKMDQRSIFNKARESHRYVISQYMDK